MIMINIPMPEKCEDCPMSYYIRSGDYEGMMMCNAMEARDKYLLREPTEDVTKNYLVDEWKPTRPENCPIKSPRDPDFQGWYELMEEIRTDTGT